MMTASHNDCMLHYREQEFYLSEHQKEEDFEVLNVASQCLCPPHYPNAINFWKNPYLLENVCTFNDMFGMVARAPNWPDPQYLTDGAESANYSEAVVSII